MSTETVKLKIEGMSCQHCVRGVNDIISEVDGIVSKEVSLENNAATVAFDNSKTSAQQIADHINSTHYKATVA